MNDHENWSKGADDGVRSAALDALDFLRCREDFWEQVCTVHTFFWIISHQSLIFGVLSGGDW